MRKRAARFLAHPATPTIAFLIAGYVAFFMLSQGEGDNPYKEQYPWMVWTGTVSVAIAMALTLGAQGIATVSG